MDNDGTTVIIIDNNVTNGTYLSKFCKEHWPDCYVCWLLICSGDEPTMPDGVDYVITRSLKFAARLIDERDKGGRGVVVFYNPQLGMFQRNVAAALDSHITQSLRRLVADKQRAVLVNIHSTDMPTRDIARYIDESFETDPTESRVISHHLITGASPHVIRDAVDETLGEWERRFAGAYAGSGE